MKQLSDQETNAEVAKRLGLTAVKGYPLKYIEYRNGETEFSPATDPAAAVWAWKRYCMQQRVCGVLRFLGAVSEKWTCWIGPEPEQIPVYDDECQAICAAIREAGG